MTAVGLLLLGGVLGFAAAYWHGRLQLRASLALAQSQSQAQQQLLEERLQSERRQAEEKLQLLADARTQLGESFKLLASDILEDKSRRFTEQNQLNLQQLLDPLRNRITEFQKQVQDVYHQEGRERSELKAQVQQMMELNQRLSQDAQRLTRSLTTQVKTQGNWGELILQRALELAGLQEGREFSVQPSHSTEQGRQVPDVVVHLPRGRSLVIDAKVSLNAWNDYVNAGDDEAARLLALRRHLESLRTHVKGLGERHYQQLHGAQSLDCVLLFVPIESAFLLALEHDLNLWQDGWKRNILLVGPTTLLFAVRTVAQLWRQEQQSQNAQDIARRGGLLYDKLVGFVEDFLRLGERLRLAQEGYQGSLAKLSSGRDNVVSQAQKLKAMGVQASKELPPSLVEQSLAWEDGAEVQP